ncbi:MAG: FAD-dependent oxidoreductase [Verrucomicrobiota bacterium JB023]|nr:FAD-dependent oxidoreductase [Verrucomicrobiota bacterium JB023]
MKTVIVGGGVVGLCSAYYLSRSGAEVVVIDGDPARQASCSDGNAGMVVPSHFVPLAAPGVISQGLKWMLNPKSPFYLRPRPDLNLMKWCWLFMRHSNEAHVKSCEHLLRDLSLESRRLFVDLAKEEDFELVQKGLLMLCASEAGLEEEAEVAEHANRLGIEAEVCDLDRLKELEPGVELAVKGGVWFGQDCHLNPSIFLAKLREAVVREGGEFIEGRVSHYLRDKGTISGVQLRDGVKVKGDKLVLAGGVEAPALMKEFGLKLPMQGGKGYSLTLKEPRKALQLCSLLKEGRVAVTPMGDQLRVAGTMEICGEDLSLNKRRIAGILESFVQFYPEFSKEDFEGVEPWSGLRPCTPDGLPYLGKLEKEPNVVVAAGHSMVGLSLGPVTGQIVSRLVSGEDPEFDLHQLRSERFG